MTLYRKYRPQKFADVVNQKPIKETIQNQILKNKVSHAYLFTGPRGVGKTTMARILAKSLNCANRKPQEFEPCNKCSSCLEINKGISLDLIEQDAASNRGIDEIRNLRDSVRVSPSKSLYKIFIIDEVHMLTAPAFNALLKTLEEPPEHTVFILATTEPHKIPDTIISRCQRFDFKRVSHKEIVSFLQKIVGLEGIKVDEGILDTISIRSQGCVRDALSMLGKIITIGTGDKDKIITWEEAKSVIPRSNLELIKSFVDSVKSARVRESFNIISKLVEEGVDLEQFLIDTIDYLRNGILNIVLGEELAPELNEDVKFYRKFIDILLSRFDYIKQVDFLPQLPLELSVLDYFQHIKFDYNSKDLKNKNIASLDKDPKSSRDNNLKKIGNPKKLGNPDLSFINGKWEEVLSKVEEYNNSLPVALSSCRPVDIKGDTIVLGFKFKLHYDIIKNDFNRIKLERILKDIFGIALKVECIIAENSNLVPNKILNQKTAPQDLEDDLTDAVDGVKEVFG